MKTSTALFQNHELRLNRWGMAIPISWVALVPFVDASPLARMISIAVAAFVAAGLYCGSRLGVAVVGDEVRIVNFFKTIRLTRAQIDHFEPDVMYPEVKLLADEHRARMVLRSGEDIVVTGLKPRYSMLTCGTEDELRAKVAELNSFLGLEPSTVQTHSDGNERG